MKDIEDWESEFRAQLRSSLLKAINGQHPTLFSLDEQSPNSQSLLAAAKYIMELRQKQEQHAPETAAANYLLACLRWRHLHDAQAEAGPRLAKGLLLDIEPEVI